MATLSVDYRSKELPPLNFDEKDIKSLVSGVPKTFDEAKPSPAHRMIVAKRHVFYNRQVSQIRAVNRNAMKFADIEVSSPIEQLVAVHYESTAVVALLRDGSVVAITAADMPDKAVKLSVTPLTAEGKAIKNATALCILQSQSTSHSNAYIWSNKQILVFSGGADKSAPLTVTRIIPSTSDSSLSVEKTENIAAAGTWANTFGAVTSASAGQNGFVAVCGSQGKVQVLHESDLGKGVLSRPLTPHNETGAQAAVFLPRDTVTSDADPTGNSAASDATDSIMTTAVGGHEVRLWGLRGNSVNLLQTIAISNDKENTREVAVDISTSDMTFLVSKGNGAGTIIAIEPETDRASFRRITEWSLPETAAILSVCACPAPTGAGVSAKASRFCVFVRTDKGVARYVFDERINGASNVSSSSAAAASGDDSSSDKKKDSSAEGETNVSKWFGGASAVADSGAAAADKFVDPAIKSSKEVVSVKAGQRTTTVEGTSSKDVQAAVSAALQDASAQHLASAGRFYEQSDAVVQSLELALGQALGSLRIPAVRQRSNEVAAEWARKATRAIEEAVRVAVQQKGGAAAKSSNGNNNNNDTVSAASISGFSPTLAQNFYTSFLENIHAAASTVVDHSLEKLLESAVNGAIDKVWPAVQNVLDESQKTSGNQIPRVTALPSFTEFSNSIAADQARQNAAVKRQVEQNKRDLAMYEGTTGNVANAEQYLAKLQSAVKELNAAVIAAKAPSTIAGTETVTPANEDEIFAKLIKMAKDGQWLNATNTIANGGSLSLLIRFFDSPEVEPHEEELCSPKGMTPISFVTIIKLLSRGLVSAAAVALTARVTLLKRIIGHYALEVDKEGENGKTVTFLKTVLGDLEEAKRELARVNGPDRNTMKNAKVAIRAMEIFGLEDE